VVLENPSLRIAINPDGQIRRIMKKSPDRDLLDHRHPARLMHFTLGDQLIEPVSVKRTNQQLDLTFSQPGLLATLSVEERPEAIVLQLINIQSSGAGYERVYFFNCHSTLGIEANDPFAIGVFPLTLGIKADVPQGLNHKLGVEGAGKYAPLARLAIAGGPREHYREQLQAVLALAPELPQSPIGGPRAADNRLPRESYLIDHPGLINERNIDAWIATAKQAGMGAIDFHCGPTIRFGDYQPLAPHYTGGHAGLKQVIDKVHAAGLKASLHTYAYMIDKKTPWVTPIPDRDLATGREFTLSRDISANEALLPVNETTDGMSTRIEFLLRNSVTLRIDDELIVFHDFATSPPYGFSRCERGVLGTTAAPHKQGAKVYHLREVFGLFAPKAESALYDKVAAAIANTANQCGFDSIMFDAMDGGDTLSQYWEVPYTGPKFVNQVYRQLKQPLMIDLNYEYWPISCRSGFWDAPIRGYKRHTDLRVVWMRNQSGGWLPLQLGWYALYPEPGDQPERMFLEDIEYLYCRSLALDAGVSFVAGLTPEAVNDSLTLQRWLPVMRDYETIRRSGKLPGDLRQRLMTPGEEFHLEKLGQNHWQFRPRQFTERLIEGTSGTLKVNNPFAGQPDLTTLNVTP